MFPNVNMCIIHKLNKLALWGFFAKYSQEGFYNTETVHVITVHWIIKQHYVFYALIILTFICGDLAEVHEK